MAKRIKRLAQTPTPKKEQIYGSKTNRSGSSASAKEASSIAFSDSLTKSIQNKISDYNSKNPRNKISLAVAKAVVRRGLGAYSKTHRPTISGGAPNSRTAWGLARLSAFMRKKSGSQDANGAVSKRMIRKVYVQDDDLM
jgi:hypothetical protein|tara:strand:- start:242 stop:658 length:417 start_codon:yes stop_codon:yes gene_type:complete